MPYKDPNKQREYLRNNYLSNKDRYVSYQSRRRAYIRTKILNYLLEHPCEYCGESRPETLQFDHKDPKEKTYTISSWISTSKPKWSRVLEEINKCRVLCANCHALRTAKQHRWYENLLSDDEVKDFEKRSHK